MGRRGGGLLAILFCLFIPIAGILAGFMSIFLKGFKGGGGSGGMDRGQ